MITRQIEAQVRERLSAYPAVALVGPRQCGKTTLAQAIGGAYFDLEQESERLRLDLAWEELTKGDDLLILDEAQSWPEVFVRVRGAIDSDRKRLGRFLLLGSVSPTLMVRVSESLAGRLSLVQLTPFLKTELPARVSLAHHWLVGGHPDGGVITPKQYPQWQLDYLALLTQRDLPAWGLSARPQMTDRLLRMLAALHGQTWNASQVGRSLGASYHTVNSYLDYLEGAFLIRRLQPFLPNLRKRLVKRPKVYWRDSGLLHAILQVSDDQSLLFQPWVGASWEGYVIEQTLGVLSAIGRNVEPFHFRTSDQYELDLVLKSGRELWAVEMKLSSSPSPEDMNRLDKTADMIGAKRRFLVSQVARSSGDDRRVSCNLARFLKYLQESE